MAAAKSPATLVIDLQPPAEWYKDEGDKHFPFALRLNGELTNEMRGRHERVPVHITLLYESGKVVEDQHSLLECLPPAPVMELNEKQCSCRIRIKEVSSRHRHQQFVIRAELAGIKGLNHVTADPVRVLSKHTRHNRKRKRKAAAADTDGFDPTLAKEDPVRLTVEVLRALEWIKIGRDKGVYQCPSCNAVYLVGVNLKVHKPRCKLRHLISVFSRAPQGGAAPAPPTPAPTTVDPATLLPTPRQPKRARRGRAVLPTPATATAAAAAAAAAATPAPASNAVAATAAAMGAGAVPLVPATVVTPSGALGREPSFNFENQLALEFVDSLPSNEQSTLSKLARNFSIGSLVRSLSWGRSSSTDNAL